MMEKNNEVTFNGGIGKVIVTHNPKLFRSAHVVYLFRMNDTFI